MQLVKKALWKLLKRIELWFLLQKIIGIDFPTADPWELGPI